MGTTYRAQVEVFFESTPFINELWEAVSRWELGKDYSFSAAWFKVAERGLPKDFEMIGERPHPKYGYDLDQVATGTGETLAELEPDYHGVVPSIWFIGLRNHVRELISAGYRVRVITWGQ